MNILQKRRLLFVGILCIVSILATFLIIQALRQNVNFYFTPTQIAEGKAKNGLRIRVGGIVQKESVVRGQGLEIAFTITDFTSSLRIYYTGILPDLFKEGQGIVVLGSLNQHKQFFAEEVLAKHDENYLPPEIKR